MKLYLHGTFDSPIAPAMLPRPEFASIMAEHGVEVVAHPESADCCLVDAAVDTMAAVREPPVVFPGGWFDKSETILVCGEPPQPEYLLPCYRAARYKAIVTPLNGTYADEYAYYQPPPADLPALTGRNGRGVQLATNRTVNGNLGISINGGERRSVVVLCAIRAQVGLALHTAGIPLDIYGGGWPEGVALDCSRGRPDFLEERHRISARYGFDLCWENTAIEHYATEKFWSPVANGTLPVYFGPSGFSPPGILDCRQFLHAGQFDAGELARALIEMSEDERLRRVRELRDWYLAIPRDAAHASWTKAAHHLAEVVAG